MFSYAKSLLQSVFTRKRPLESDTEDQDVKRAKIDSRDNQDDGFHRIRITNFPKKDWKTVRKQLIERGLKSMSKAPKWDYAIITASSEEEAKDMLSKLEGYQFKGKKIEAEYTHESKAKYEQRMQKLDKKKRPNNKKDQNPEDDTRTPAEKLADQVTPLHKLSYEEQLVKKDRNNRKVLDKLKWKLMNVRDVPEDKREQLAWIKARKGPICDIEKPIGSPTVNGYRTKCEFTIGHDLEGKPTVGFLLGLYKLGITAVLDPSDCLNVPDIAKRIARAMQDYVRESEYPVYSRSEKVGVWRTLLTKTQSTGEVMILVQMNTDTLSEDQVAKEKQKLIEYWNDFKNQQGGAEVTTLLFQAWNGASNGITDRTPVEVLTGDGIVHEELLGCKFRISSSSFFQVNTAATEILYSKCAEWCNVGHGKKTTLLDLCCGTGTIGITMAKSVDRVIGIEMVPEAIVDAGKNCALNDIKNIEYYTGKVEDKVNVISTASNEEVVAVLDPPRSGVHPSVIQAIRGSPLIKRVVYISCDSRQALDDFVGLCKATSKKYPGSPFRPTRAVSIDLFPHTEHCELVIEFMRDDVLEEYLKENSIDKPTEDVESNDVKESIVEDVHANEETTNNQNEAIPSSSSPVTNEEKET